MKKVYSVVSSYLGHVGFYFLLTILFFSVVALVKVSATFNLVLVWSALLFAALLGLADVVFALKFLGSYLVKLVVHIILATVAFAVSFVWISGGIIEESSTAVVGVLAFAFIMILVSVVRGVVHTAFSKKENENKAYNYLYTAQK
jgi:hypothetical protein